MTAQRINESAVVALSQNQPPLRLWASASPGLHGDVAVKPDVKVLDHSPASAGYAIYRDGS